MPINFTKVFVQPTFYRSTVNVGRQSQRSGTWRTPADAVSIDRHLFGIEMNLSFALKLPQAILDILPFLKD